MQRAILLSLTLALPTAYAQTPQAAPPVPHHEANFEAERTQADQLWAAQKFLDVLPLYADLSRQDPTVAVFAERHGAAMLTTEQTITDPQTRLNRHLAAINELKRAQSLGDNSAYVRTVLDADSKTLVGAIMTGIPISVGYTYKGKPEAQKTFQQAEAAFGHSDFAAAAKLYVQAAEIDPAWYDPPLYAGDMYFRMKDAANAGIWFSKAIAIDPDRETAYRYWGDALFQSGDVNGAREKLVNALVAEPYARGPQSELNQWAQRTGHKIGIPLIQRPDFGAPNGELKIDPALAASTQDGRSSWIIYQQYRVEHGARTLNQIVLPGGTDVNGVTTVNGYQHTIAEEHAALRAMLKDINEKLKAGTLTEAALDPSLKNIRALERGDNLGAWIAINGADLGIHQDYPSYRSNHRKHLVDYINTIQIR